MPGRVAVACLLLSAALAVAQTDSGGDEVPATAAPPTPEWRLGFDLGNLVILETPELNPGGNEAAARRVAQALLPDTPAALVLNVLPFLKVPTESRGLLNTRQWAVMDQHGNVRQREFRWLAVLQGQAATARGGYHLASGAAVRAPGPIVPDRTPTQENIVFAAAGLPGPPPQVRTRLTQTPWRDGIPVESPDDLPAGYAAAKARLAPFSPDAARRIVYGSSMRALLQKRVETLWLLNYGDPDLKRGSHPWGIFIAGPVGLLPVYIATAVEHDGGRASFHANLFAGIDADRDGNDDLVVEARSAAGVSYKVIAVVNGTYREIRTSYLR
jgi:hypothetical protein